MWYTIYHWCLHFNRCHVEVLRSMINKINFGAYTRCKESISGSSEDWLPTFGLQFLQFTPIFPFSWVPYCSSPWFQLPDHRFSSLFDPPSPLEHYIHEHVSYFNAECAFQATSCSPIQTGKLWKGLQGGRSYLYLLRMEVRSWRGKYTRIYEYRINPRDVSPDLCRLLNTCRWGWPDIWDSRHYSLCASLCWHPDKSILTLQKVLVNARQSVF